MLHLQNLKHNFRHFCVFIKPNFMSKNQKKVMSQSYWENSVTNRRSGRKKSRPKFIGSSGSVGDQKKKKHWASLRNWIFLIKGPSHRHLVKQIKKKISVLALHRSFTVSNIFSLKIFSQIIKLKNKITCI